VSEEKIKKISAYQKQELPVAAIFDNGSGRNGNIYRGFSIDATYQVSFGQAVTEEKIQM
jgi:hypothetical protein